MKFAEEVADQIIFMDAGNIVEAANPRSFFRNPKTERAKQFLERYMPSL
jgi:ABC-type polar amino acid transport system ATPase subunit